MTFKKASDLPWTDQRYRDGRAPKDGPAIEESFIRLGQLHISLHQYIYDPGKWFVTCYEIGLVRHPLKAALVDVAAAKDEAFYAVRARLTTHLAALNKAIE